MAQRTPLVIGVGNRDRGDDAAGPLVIDALRRSEGPPLKTTEVDGDLSDLAKRWDADQTVVIVDACYTGRAPGTVVVVDGLTTEFPRGREPVSSHGIGVADAIELARLLDLLPRSLTIYGIEAGSFDHFAAVTEPVEKAILEVVDRIRDADSCR